MACDRDNIYDWIDCERAYQDERWGATFDDQNTANDWVTYINRYAAKACEFDISTVKFQKAMIKVAALAVAAIETVRRVGSLPPRHYDQAKAETVGTMEFSGKFEDLPGIKGLILKDISMEEWREYAVGCNVYRIYDPVGLYYREGGTTHRIVGADGICHCVPFPNNGKTILRWKDKDSSVPVKF